MIRRGQLFTSRLVKPMVISRGFKGGVPGNNLPWKMDNPYRFMAWWLFWGTIGFGAPWFLIRHQLLRKDGLGKIVYIYEVRLEDERDSHTAKT